MKEAVGIFARLCDKITAVSDADVASYIGEDAADRQCGIYICTEQDIGQHGSSCRLSVCTADSDGKMVILHQLAQQLRPAQGRDPFFMHGYILRIVGVNGSCKDCKINVVGDVFGALADKYLDTRVLQLLCGCGFTSVRTGYCKTLTDQNLCQAAHGYSADSDKKDVDRFLEIYLIHFVSVSFFCLSFKTRSRVLRAYPANEVTGAAR